jgi:sortase A
MASDLIFSDSLETTAAMATQIGLGLEQEIQAPDRELVGGRMQNGPAGRQEQPMSLTARAARQGARVFLAAGLVALGYAAYLAIDAKVYQAVEQRRFERARQEAAPEPTLVEGSSIGEIGIPRLRLAAMVAEGDSAAVLQRAVGHLAGTALPGEPGNVVLAGHRDTFFRPLRQVRIGDVISLKTRGGDFEYLVESTAVVPPTAVDVLQATRARTLTLITCYPFAFIGAAPDRFIVRARERAKRN